MTSVSLSDIQDSTRAHLKSKNIKNINGVSLVSNDLSAIDTVYNVSEEKRKKFLPLINAELNLEDKALLQLLYQSEKLTIEQALTLAHYALQPQVDREFAKQLTIYLWEHQKVKLYYAASHKIKNKKQQNHTSIHTQNRDLLWTSLTKQFSDHKSDEGARRETGDTALGMLANNDFRSENIFLKIGPIFASHNVKDYSPEEIRQESQTNLSGYLLQNSPFYVNKILRRPSAFGLVCSTYKETTSTNLINAIKWGAVNEQGIKDYLRWAKHPARVLSRLFYKTFGRAFYDKHHWAYPPTEDFIKDIKAALREKQELDAQQLQKPSVAEQSQNLNGIVNQVANAIQSNTEVERLITEQKAKEEAERLLIAEQKAKEEAERLVVEQKAKEEAERLLIAEQKAKEEAERLVAEQKAKEEAERLLIAEQKAKEEVERLVAEQKAKEEAERLLIAEQKAKEEAERLLIAEQKAKEEAERLVVEQKAKEEAERLEIKQTQLQLKRKSGVTIDFRFGIKMARVILPEAIISTYLRDNNYLPEALTTASTMVDNSALEITQTLNTAFEQRTNNISSLNLPSSESSSTVSSPLKVFPDSLHSSAASSPLKVFPDSLHSSAVSSPLKVFPDSLHSSAVSSPLKVFPDSLHSSAASSPLKVFPDSLHSSAVSSPLKVFPDSLHSSAASSPLKVFPDSPEKQAEDYNASTENNSIYFTYTYMENGRVIESQIDLNQSDDQFLISLLKTIVEHLNSLGNEDVAVATVIETDINSINNGTYFAYIEEKNSESATANAVKLDGLPKELLISLVKLIENHANEWTKDNKNNKNPKKSKAKPKFASDRFEIIEENDIASVTAESPLRTFSDLSQSQQSGTESPLQVFSDSPQRGVDIESPIKTVSDLTQLQQAETESPVQVFSDSPQSGVNAGSPLARFEDSPNDDEELFIRSNLKKRSQRQEVNSPYKPSSAKKSEEGKENINPQGQYHSGGSNNFFFTKKSTSPKKGTFPRTGSSIVSPPSSPTKVK